MKKDSVWKPWIRFEDQSSSYTNGFEAGMIYQQMQSGEPIAMNIHRTNGVQIQAMASKMGYSVKLQPIEGDHQEWFWMTAEKQIRRIK